MSPQFNEARATEFFDALPTQFDHHVSEEQQKNNIPHQTPMQLLVKILLDPEIEDNPEAEGERIGKLLWAHTQNFGGDRIHIEMHVRDLWNRFARNGQRNSIEAHRIFVQKVFGELQGLSVCLGWDGEVRFNMRGIFTAE